MLVYGFAHYHNFFSGGSILGLPSTFPATLQAMQTCTVVDVASLSSRHPPPQRQHVLLDTPKDAHVYDNMATFSNVNMNFPSSITFDLKYCAR